MMTQQTNRTEQRSKYNNVGIVSDRQFNGETVYLKAAHDLRGKSYWHESAEILDQCSGKDAQGLARIEEKAKELCPVYHGPVGSFHQIQRINTGAY